jgi:phage/plasmid-associated DNA primase
VEATQEYRAEQDRLGTFIRDRCIVDSSKRVRVEKLLEAYMAWCSINKHYPMNGNAFGRELTSRGFPLEEKGSKYRKGLELQQ